MIWCPYLNTTEEGEEEEEDTSCAYLLLLTHGETVEIWDLNTVIDEHGTGPLRPEVDFYFISQQKQDNVIFIFYSLNTSFSETFEISSIFYYAFRLFSCWMIMNRFIWFEYSHKNMIL